MKNIPADSLPLKRPHATTNMKDNIDMRSTTAW